MKFLKCVSKISEFLSLLSLCYLHAAAREFNIPVYRMSETDKVVNICVENVLFLFHNFNTWARVLLRKLIVTHLIKKFPTLLHSISRRLIILLSSHLCLGLTSGFSSSAFQTKMLYAFV
jgi:hypothetical protein